VTKHGKWRGKDGPKAKKTEEPKEAEVLFPEVPEAVIGGVFRLPTDRIIPNPDQPRQYFDEAKIQRLAETLRKRGDVEHPLIITPRKNSDGQMIAWLIAGERRLRAAKLISLPMISCYIRESMGDKDAYFISVQENVGREDMSPIEKAYSLRRVMKDNGWTQSETARHLGISPTTISHLNRYFSLHEDIQALVLTGKLDKGVAVQLTTYDKERQLELLQIVKDAIEQRGRPFSPNDMLIFLRRKAEELEIRKTTRAKKSRPHLSSAELLFKEAGRKFAAATKTAEQLLKLPPADLKNWKHVNPLTVLDEIRLLQKALPKVEAVLNKKVE